MPVLQKKSNIWHYAPEKMRCIEKYLHFKISSAIITKRLGPKWALYSYIINGTSPSTYKLSSWSRLRLILLPRGFIRQRTWLPKVRPVLVNVHSFILCATLAFSVILNRNTRITSRQWIFFPFSYTFKSLNFSS